MTQPQLDHQAVLDRMRREYLAKRGAPGRQQAIVDFILGCGIMASELKQLLYHQRDYPSSAPYFAETMAHIEDRVAKEFRDLFGHPLFVETKEPAYCGECGCDLPATSDGDRISLCLRCRMNPPDVG